MRASSALILFVAFAAAAGDEGTKKRRPLPDEFGKVIIDNGSTLSGLPAVVFQHWFHRTRYTCRLCHVDLGFAMKAGGTDVKAADNAKGFFCGACHDGRRKSGDRRIFASCDKAKWSQNRAVCVRCHAAGLEVKPEHGFAEVTSTLPRGRFGNGVDWEKAEEQGLIKPVDSLEGISIARRPLAVQKDFALTPKLVQMPEIIFSHQKHTAWNGCELCHPDIFVGVKRGVTKYTMVENFQGKYCGACHLNVAFPMLDCQRCHTGNVQ